MTTKIIGAEWEEAIDSNVEEFLLNVAKHPVEFAFRTTSPTEYEAGPRLNIGETLSHVHRLNGCKTFLRAAKIPGSPEQTALVHIEA